MKNGLPIDFNIYFLHTRSGGRLVLCPAPQRQCHEAISREGVLMQIKQMNRLESTAFYIDTIIRTEKKGDWRRLWQDSQSGLFIVRGKVLAGLDLDKLHADNVNIVDGKVLISLPPVEILSVDLENIEVYDIQTGSFNLLPVDKAVFKTVQDEAKNKSSPARVKPRFWITPTVRRKRSLKTCLP